MKKCKQCKRVFTPNEHFEEKEWCDSKCEYEYKLHSNKIASYAK